MQKRSSKRMSIVRLDAGLVRAAKKVLGLSPTTTTIETFLSNLLNNRLALELFKRNSGKSKWKGFSVGGEPL